MTAALKLVQEFVKFYVALALLKAALTAALYATGGEAATAIKDCYTPFFPDPKTVKKKMRDACDRRQDGDVLTHTFQVQEELLTDVAGTGSLSMDFVDVGALAVDMLLDKQINDPSNIHWR